MPALNIAKSCKNWNLVFSRQATGRIVHILAAGWLLIELIWNVFWFSTVNIYFVVHTSVCLLSIKLHTVIYSSIPYMSPRLRPFNKLNNTGVLSQCFTIFIFSTLKHLRSKYNIFKRNKPLHQIMIIYLLGNYVWHDVCSDVLRNCVEIVVYVFMT